MKYAKPCGSNDQLELARLAHAGERRALASLVATQNGLVRRIALSFARQSPHVELDDLIQEGYLAVMDAARWFQPERGFQFSTYAGDCIRRRMCKWLRSRQGSPLPGQESSGDAEGEGQLEEVVAPVYLDPAEQLRELLTLVPPLARAVLRKRHGLDGGPTRAEVIARDLGLTRLQERARYRQAFQSLRSSLGIPSPRS